MSDLEAQGNGKSVLFMFAQSSASVADEGYRALLRGDSFVITGWMNKLMMLPVPLLPYWLQLKISRLVLYQL